MAMPHKIYCDYLEDKGIDTRLLRTQEVNGISMSSHKDYYDFYYYNESVSGNGYGIAGPLFGTISGDGRHYPNNLAQNGDGFGAGKSGDISGGGQHIIDIRGSW